MRKKGKFFSAFTAVLAVSGALWAAGGQPFTLADPGSNFVDYQKYGVFLGLGTPDYQYKVNDAAGLARALGEGIYPNNDSVFKDPAYLQLKDKLDIPKDNFGLWEGDPDQPQVNFLRWAASQQDPASKLFFVGLSLKDAQMWLPALKAFYALLVQFPAATRKNSGDPDSWSVSLAQKSKDEIIFILREHPELGLEFKGAQIEIENPGSLEQKVVKLHPGYFVKAPPKEPFHWGNAVSIRGTGKVKLVEYPNQQWVMAVDNKPYFMKGLCYGVTKIGQSPDLMNMVGFTDVDDPPGIFDSWVDKNKNNSQDADEPAVGDPALLKNMGCNTIRLYFGAKSKKSLDRFCKESGVKVAMGVAFGAYALDSGSTWEKGTDYTDPQQQDHMLQVLKDLVLKYKDEPYILCWVLGNENNYGAATHTNADKYPATYCDLVERASKMVHALDPDHPVAACIGETSLLPKLAQFAPDLDMLAINSYRGSDGFGDLWDTARKDFDRPVFLSEFGCPAFYNGKGEDEEDQAKYLAGAWRDISYNRAGGVGAGNSVGGFVFEWCDEWWKAGAWKPPSQHDASQGQWAGPFPDGRGHEEWFGITSQGNGSHSPYMRQLRKAYWTLRALWGGGS
jgi:hypothetical protein